MIDVRRPARQRRSTCGPGELVTAIEMPVPPADFGAAYTRLVRRRGHGPGLGHPVRVRSTGPASTQLAYGSVGPRAFLVSDDSGVLADPDADPAARAAILDELLIAGDALAALHPGQARLPPGDAARAGHARPGHRPRPTIRECRLMARTTHHRPDRQRSRARARRGRSPHPAGGAARRRRPHRHQGVLRRGRVRRLHRARRRPLGQLLPDAGGRGRRQPTSSPSRGSPSDGELDPLQDGVPRPERGPVRLLHPRPADVGHGPARARSPSPPTSRSRRRWRATSVAVRATSRSSRPCTRRRAGRPSREQAP